jgi:hypothetical protein
MNLPPFDPDIVLPAALDRRPEFERIVRTSNAEGMMGAQGILNCCIWAWALADEVERLRAENAHLKGAS